MLLIFECLLWNAIIYRLFFLYFFVISLNLTEKKQYKINIYRSIDCSSSSTKNFYDCFQNARTFTYLKIKTTRWKRLNKWIDNTVAIKMIFDWNQNCVIKLDEKNKYFLFTVHLHYTDSARIIWIFFLSQLHQFWSK